jgi:hypothetical protein
LIISSAQIAIFREFNKNAGSQARAFSLDSRACQFISAPILRCAYRILARRHGGQHDQP